MTQDLRLVDLQLNAKKVGKDAAIVATKLRTTVDQCYALKNVIVTFAKNLTTCAESFERIAHDPDGLIEEIAAVEGWCDQLQNFRNFLVCEGRADDISPAKTSARISDVSGRQLQPSDQDLKHTKTESGKRDKPEAKEVIMKDGNTGQTKKIRVRVWGDLGWQRLEHDWLPMMDGVMVAAECVCGVRVSKEVRWDVEWSKEECKGCGREVRFEWK
jgi:hypothetical protein